MHRYDVDQIVNRYGLQEHDLLPLIRDFSGYWIAGGAVRAFLENRKISTDVDVFFRNEQHYNRFLSIFAEDPVVSPHHATFEYAGFKVQAIKIAWYASIEECLDSFDFTICQFGISGSSLYCGPYSLWDLARKRLAVNKITYASASVRRLLKYSTQGFTACQGCVQELLQAVADDPTLIRSDVQYVD